MPKEGYSIFMDSVAILKDAKNPENAKLFMNFIMAPENAALISNFATYANGIKGSEQFMRTGLKDAPELNIPADFQAAGGWQETCSPEVNELYSKVWKDLLEVTRFGGPACKSRCGPSSLPHDQAACSETAAWMLFKRTELN